VDDVLIKARFQVEVTSLTEVVVSKYMMFVFLSNCDQFSEYFHWKTWEKICHKTIGKLPTTRKRCCCITLYCFQEIASTKARQCVS